MADVSLDIGIKAEGLKNIVTDLKNLNKELDNTKKTSNTASKSINSVKKSTKETNKDVNKLSDSFKNLATNPLVLLIGAITAFAIATKKSTEAINQQIKAEQQLLIATKTNKNLTKESTKNLAEYASELQSVTTFGDEYTLSLMKMGAQAGMTEQQIKDMTTLALDISAQTSEDAETVMRDLTESYKDAGAGAEMLKSVYITMTIEEKKHIAELQESGRQMEANQIIIDKLTASYGGAAIENANTFAGTWQQIDNIIGDVAEEFGRVVMAFSKPVSLDLKRALDGVYTFITDPVIIDAVQNIVTTIQVMFDVLGNVVSFVFTTINKNLDVFILAFENVVNEVSELGIKFEQIGSIGTLAFTHTILMIKETITIVSKLGIALFQLQTGQFAGLKETAKDLGDSFKKMFDPKGLLKEANTLNKGLVESFKKTKEDVRKNWEFGIGGSGGSLMGNALPNTVTQNEAATDEIKSAWSSLADSIGGIMSSLTNLSSEFLGNNVVNTEEFDAQLEAIDEKYANIYETRAEGEETVDDNFKKQIEYLETEYLLQDKLGKQAIDILLKETKAEEKARKDEEKAEKKKADEIAKLEIAKQKEIANAEYQKALVIHKGDVENAKTKHGLVIAESTIAIAQGTTLAALAFAKVNATVPFPVGLVAGATLAAGIIGSVASGASAIASSASSLNSIQGSAPTPPSFRFGTQGYELPSGGSAIVGESGTEVITSNNGVLEVQSAYQTAQSGTGSGGGVTNININASQFSMAQIKELMIEILSSNDVKRRDVTYAV